MGNFDTYDLRRIDDFHGETLREIGTWAADEIEQLRNGLKRLDSWDILTDEDRHEMIAEILSGEWPPQDDGTLPCCGSESGVHLIGCDSEDAKVGRIHRVSTGDSDGE